VIRLTYGFQTPGIAESIANALSLLKYIQVSVKVDGCAVEIYAPPEFAEGIEDLIESAIRDANGELVEVLPSVDTAEA